jgi:hypothetical protein
MALSLRKQSADPPGKERPTREGNGTDGINPRGLAEAGREAGGPFRTRFDEGKADYPYNQETPET